MRTQSTLVGSEWFSKVDLYSGFWQINICEEDHQKSAFSVLSRLYKFSRWPYILANSPTSFQRLVEIVSRNLTGHECWVFMYDVIIFSDSVQEDAKWLASVFERFKKANLQLQPEKCGFANIRVAYLGYVGFIPYRN